MLYMLVITVQFNENGYPVLYEFTTFSVALINLLEYGPI